MVRFLIVSTFLLAPPLFAQGDAEFQYIAPDSVVVYDVATGEGSGDVGILIAEDPGNTGFPNTVTGWSMGNMIDSAFVQVTEVVLGDYLQTINDGDGPDFFSPIVLPNGFTVGCVYNLLGGAECTYEVPKEAVRITLLTIPAALVGDDDGETANMTWVDTLGTPAVPNILFASGPTAFVVPDDGVLSLVPLGEQWIRGDADGDGVFNALPDALFTVNFGFLGGPPPPCLEATDADGDATFNALADALYTLSHGFVGGPPPSAPYPLCGSDPDPGTSLGCDASTCP